MVEICMLDYDAVIDWRFDDVVHAYTTRDTIIYALGLGYGRDPVDVQRDAFGEGRGAGGEGCGDGCGVAVEPSATLG